MYGDDADRKTPRAIRRLLLLYGGRTPTGLPYWRLVEAGKCKILCQGRVHHFPRGVELSINTRPLRIAGGRFLLPRYRSITPTDWILERWFAPWVWGGEAEWRSHRSDEAGARLFVEEFPSAGNYFMLAGPWPTIEEAGDLRAPIRIYMRREREKRRVLEDVIRERVAAEHSENDRRLEQLEQEFSRAQTVIDEISRTVSPTAQAVREVMAAQAGVPGHLGASESWG